MARVFDEVGLGPRRGETGKGLGAVVEVVVTTVDGVISPKSDVGATS